MTDLTAVFQRLSTISQAVNTPLNTAADVKHEAGIDREFSHKIGSRATFSAGIGASASVQLLNSPKDDGSGVHGTLVAGEAEGVQWRPVLDAAAPQRVWLKYSAAGSIKAGIAGSVGPISFGINGSGSLQAATYMPHPKSAATIGQAVVADLSDLPQIFDTADLRNLQDGQAVSLEMVGAMGFNVSLDWSDLLARSIDPLSALAQGGSALAIKIKGGLSAAFKIVVKDTFRVVFAGIDGTWLTLQVWRDDSRNADLSFDAQISAQFADPEAAQKVLSGAAAGLLQDAGLPLDELRDRLQVLIDSLNGLHGRLMGLGNPIVKRVQEWLAARTAPAERVLGRLAELQQLVADSGFDAGQLATALNLGLADAQRVLDEVVGWPKELDEKLDAALEKLWERLSLDKVQEKLAWLLKWLNQLEETIGKIAKLKAGLSFKYEWHRTVQNTSVARMEINQNIGNLAAFHEAALDLDGGELLRLANAAGAQVRNGILLGEKLDQRRAAFGFTLGIGKWQRYSKWSKGRTVLSQTRQLQNQAGMVRHALTGWREYEDSFYDVKYHGDLAINMHGFQPPGTAPSQWEINCNLLWQTQTKQLGLRDLHKILDHAVLWNLVDAGQLETHLRQLGNSSLMGAKVQAIAQLTLGNSAFADTALQKLLLADPRALWAQAVAGSLSWLESYPERSSVEAREHHYRKLAPAFAVTESPDGDSSVAKDFALAAFNALSDSGNEIAQFEFRQRQKNPIGYSAGSIAELVYRSGNLKRNYQNTREGLERLGRIATGTSVEKALELAKEAIDLLDGNFNRSFGLRAFGRLLVLLHRQAQPAQRSLGGTLTLKLLGANDVVRETWTVQSAR